MVKKLSCPNRSAGVARRVVKWRNAQIEREKQNETGKVDNLSPAATEYGE